MALFGSKPKRPPRPDAEAALFENAQAQRGTMSALSPLVRLRLADISDPSNEIREQRGVANADFSQGMGQMSATPVTRNTAFQRAMARAKGLTRVAMMGEEAARTQGIRDRASVASFGQAFRRGQAGSLAGLASSQAITDASRMQARQIGRASQANLFGTLAGAAASGYNAWRTRPVSFESPDLSYDFGMPADLPISNAAMGI